MSRNGREWCLDEDGKTSRRVVRGGGWNVQPDVCRAARHDSAVPVDRSNNLGLRVARVRAATQAAAWQPLFNGKDLTGLTQRAANGIADVPAEPKTPESLS